MRKCFYNGSFIEESDAKISIYDSALMFGDMVFEMTRSFNKKHFKLEQHIDRLLIGCKILRIPVNYSKQEIIDICYKVSEINEEFFSDTDEHRLMINVSRGPLGIYSHLFKKKEPTFIISDFPLKWTVSTMGDLFDKGVNGVITNQKAIPHRYLDPKIKNRSRIHYQMANIEASLFQGDNNWPVLMDENGFIAEGSGDNLFFIKDDKIYTPKGHDILRGISRQYIFDLCHELNLEVIEKDLTPYDAYCCQESFMTATPFCLLPMSSLNSIKISEGIGNITKKILNQWSKNVGVDIANQIKFFNSEHKAEKGNPTPYSFKK